MMNKTQNRKKVTWDNYASTRSIPVSIPAGENFGGLCVFSWIYNFRLVGRENSEICCY